MLDARGSTEAQVSMQASRSQLSCVEAMRLQDRQFKASGGHCTGDTRCLETAGVGDSRQDTGRRCGTGSKAERQQAAALHSCALQASRAVANRPQALEEGMLRPLVRRCQ